MPRDPLELYSADPSARHLLRAVVDALERGTPVHRNSVLHDAVCERTRALRSGGMGTQTALADIKQIVREAVRRHLAIPDGTDSDLRTDAKRVLAPVEGWCIEECFRHPAS